MSRKNISLSDSVERKAEELIKSEVGDGLSDLVARLIREEWDRRNSTAPTVLRETEPATPPTATPVTYTHSPATKKAIDDLKRGDKPA